MTTTLSHLVFRTCHTMHLKLELSDLHMARSKNIPLIHVDITTAPTRDKIGILDFLDNNMSRIMNTHQILGTLDRRRNIHHNLLLEKGVDELDEDTEVGAVRTTTIIAGTNNKVEI